MIRRVASFALLASLAALAACGADPKPPESLAGYFGPEPAPNGGSVLGDQGLVFGVGKGVNRQRDQGGGSLGVNAYLWRGALDTLSFMPLASADPFGGTIITDWYSPPGTPDERFKATAFILGRELRSDGLRVTVFRQVLHDGRWEDAPVSSVTTADIENKILDRARAMRANMVASQ
ncbi:MAG: DUF3576 domain-containing protein [Acetobacteraceae bacterium]|nr:DUF3576 domain-containing protein [Acetobacteraceae bacterium]